MLDLLIEAPPLPGHRVDGALRPRPARAAKARRRPSGALSPRLLALVVAELRRQVLHHAGLAQRRDVAQLAALGDVAQQARRMIFPERVFGTSAVQMIRFGPCELADPVRHLLAHLLSSSSSPSSRSPSRITNAAIAWPVSSSCWPITAASATLGCDDDRRLDLAVDSRWPDTFDHVVHTADDPEVAVLVAARRVAYEVGVSSHFEK